MNIEDKSRKAFEEWLDCAGFEVRRYHHIPGYHGNEQQAAWEAWNAAIDSVCVELPCETGEHSEYGRGYDQAIDECHDAIRAAGIKTK